MSGTRRRALDALGDEIVRRNDAVLYHGVANQAFPVNRQIGGRWFDELGWPIEQIEGQCAATEVTRASVSHSAGL